MTEKTETKRLDLRVPVRVSNKLTADAKRCGLTKTEYLTQLIQGYTPRAYNPNVCRLLEAVDSLYSFCPDAETSAAIRAFLYDARRELLLPLKGGN